MDVFGKVVTAVLVTVLLGSSLGKQDFSVLLTMAASCMAAVVMISYLDPVLDLLKDLESVSQFGNEILSTLLKAAGIALTAELASMVCRDAGNGTLGKSLQMLGSAVILYLSVPAFRSILNLIRDILGEL